MILASYYHYRPSLFDYFNDPHTRWKMSRVPFVGDFYKAMDQEKYWNDYLRVHKMTWDDVKYPALLGGMTDVGAAFSVSRNVMRLYR